MLKLLSLFLLSIYSILIPNNAHAYIDPGMGSIIIQLILGGIGGLILLFKFYWKTIRSFFSKNKIKTKSDTAEPEKEKEEEKKSA